MATAIITFTYDQVLALAKQLTPEERKQMSAELLKEPDENSFSYWFDQVIPDPTITDEEIVQECKRVRAELFRKRQEANQAR